MATASLNTTHSAAGTGFRFLIGGLMLGLMAYWLRIAHDPAPEPQSIVIGLAGLLSCGWGARLLLSKTDADAQSAMLALGGGGIIGAAALWIGLQLKSEALGEILGLAVFSLLAISTGFGLLGGRVSDEAAWERFRGFAPIVAIFLFVLGAAALATFFYITIVRQIQKDYMPETIGLLVVGMFLAIAAFWLIAVKQETGNLRLFSIIVGALLGAVLLGVSIARGYQWGEHITRLASMTAADSWRFWLVAYGALAGLALILYGLGQSIGEIRRNGVMRQALFGYVTVVMALFLLVVLVIVNLLASPYTSNWSATRGLTTLHPKTKDLLSSIDKQTSIYVLMPETHLIYQDLRNFLGNCEAFSSKITVEYLDPYRDPTKTTKLAIRFKELLSETRDSAVGLLLVYGPMPEDVNAAVPHSFIPDRKLFDTESDRGRGGPAKMTLTFKAEVEIMKELDNLARKKEKRKLYLLQGNEELDINGSEFYMPRPSPALEVATLGANSFVDKLKKDGYEVGGLSFGRDTAKEKTANVVFVGEGDANKKPEIPTDCDTLLIPGPSARIPQAGLDAIERFMDRGGKLVVFLDIVCDRQFAKLRESGLEEFLKKYGVNVTNEFVMRVPQQRDMPWAGKDVRDPRLVLAEAPEKKETALAKQFVGVPLRLRTARIVRPGTSTRYKIEPLLVVSAKRGLIWAEDSLKSFSDLERHLKNKIGDQGIEGILARESLPVAVTVTEGEAAKPRMVVFGDAEFVSNAEVIGEGAANYDIAVGSIEWMAERGFAGPRAQERNLYMVSPDANVGRMVFGSFWTFTALFFVFGSCIWIARRR